MDEKSTPDESLTPLTDWDSQLVEEEVDETPSGPDPRFGADFVIYFDE